MRILENCGSRPKFVQPLADIDGDVCRDFTDRTGRAAASGELQVNRHTSPHWLQTTSCGLALALLALGSTGCQITEGGQTLPSPYYVQDDIQYFAPGPEFKLSREAAAQKAYKADLEAQQGAP
jgi:hypothetical protein